MLNDGEHSQIISIVKGLTKNFVEDALLLQWHSSKVMNEACTIIEEHYNGDDGVDSNMSLNQDVLEILHLKSISSRPTSDGSSDFQFSLDSTLNIIRHVVIRITLLQLIEQ